MFDSFVALTREQHSWDLGELHGRSFPLYISIDASTKFGSSRKFEEYLEATINT
jgi:hypothetical protein